MSNPDSPSCLLPSAKCGWGHAECSLLCRPDGSCKIEQFCLLKHQLFSKISISCLTAARLLLRERGRAGERCRLCSAAGATCQPRSCEKSLQHFQSCRRASPAAPYVCWALGREASPGPRGAGLLFPWLLTRATRSDRVPPLSPGLQESPRELKLSSLQDVALANHCTRQEFFPKLQRQLPRPKELGFHLLLEMEDDAHIWLQALRWKVRLLVSS